MRKLLWILASSLLWCNVGFAEIIFSKCNGLSPNYTYSTTWTINLERGIIREKTVMVVLLTGKLIEIMMMRSFHTN